MAADLGYADYTAPVSTSSGMIRGYQSGGVYCFKNILYASVVRFHSPQPVHWDGVRDATAYGFIPPTGNSPDARDSLFVPHRFGIENEEDCLNLNIWTPSLDSVEKLPIVFCVYGASFNTGCGYEMMAYEGTNLSRDGNLVYVTINMRTNMLGFFSLSCFGREYENSGNLGFEDVLAALKWVRQNASAFGGDPDNITLLGMQGGALRIRYIMQCPAFRGLFSKAFLLSGIADHGRPPKAERFHALAKGMLKEAGRSESDVDYLVHLPLDQLYELQGATVEKNPQLKVRWRVDLNGWCYGRTEDEGVCPEMTDITVVCGNTFTEQYFTPDRFPDGRPTHEQFEVLASEKFGEDKDEIISLFSQIYPDKDIRDVLYYALDHRNAIYEYCSALSKAGMKAYVYQFVPQLPFNNGTPAFHCSDVSYIMRNLDIVPSCRIPGVSEKLSDQYSGVLISLAHQGRPYQNEWKPFDPYHNNCMLFDVNCHMMEKDDRRLVELLKKHSGKK